MKRMKQAFEPARPSVRVMTLKVNSSEGFATRMDTRASARSCERRGLDADGGAQASRCQRASASWPSRGPARKPSNMSYLPALRRVRELTPLAGYEPYFGTDFTYEDLSFVRLGGHEKLDGIETHNGVRAYKLEEALSNNPYFSKVVTWVATDTDLPVERDYYDLDGKLFKTERFEKIWKIAKIPTIMKIVIKDVQSGGSSEIDVSSVKYDKQASVELFDPKRLSDAASDTFWKNAAR